LIETARGVNDAQPQHVVDLVRAAVADRADPVIALLGLAYKADVDDLRESPALEVAELLARQGFRLRLHDAYARQLPDGTPLERDLEHTLAGADLLVILTDHEPYRKLSPHDPGPAAMASRCLVDTRNCLPHARWQEAGFAVHRLGVGTTPAPAFAER
jgi:UDP-N-acetyl-D-mannosaminuronic acid dehydrogenase